MADKIIDLQNITVDFKQHKNIIRAVNDVSIGIDWGDIYGVIGYSGAGKSTLARTINLLQKPTSGTVNTFGELQFSKINGNTTEVGYKKLQHERKKIGFIFQHFNLLGQKTVFENIEFALKHTGMKDKQKKERAHELLAMVDLADQVNKYPSQLSGGQQQRVAIARALANDPEILISDEATSALDPENTNQILDLLEKLNKKLGLTILLITHEMDAVKRIANHVAVMDNGKIIASGSLIDIFVKSKNPIVQKLIGRSFDTIKILNDLHIDGANSTFIKLTFTSSILNKTVVADLYEKLGLKSNIVYSNIEMLGGNPVGIMLIQIAGDLKNRNAAVKYLNQLNVQVEEIKEDIHNERVGY